MGFLGQAHPGQNASQMRSGLAMRRALGSRRDIVIIGRCWIGFLAEIMSSRQSFPDCLNYLQILGTETQPM